MPEIICNTSPLQYLHQVDALRVFPQLVKTITIPPAVKQELEVGRALGLALPEVENLTGSRPHTFQRSSPASDHRSGGR